MDLFIVISVGVLFLATGVFLVIQTQKSLRLRSALLECGVYTTATVIGVQRNRVGRKGHSYTYTYTMEYMAGDERVTGKCMSLSQLDGDTAEIAYLPEDPKQFMLAELLPDTLGSKMHFAFPIFLCVVMLALWVFIFSTILAAQK